MDATLVFVTTLAEAGELGTDPSRDSPAAFMTARGVRPVRQAALDATWSAALDATWSAPRFRPARP
jgi:hypothetical protein